MVRASHRRSEGCEFGSRLGLRNISVLSLQLSLSSEQFTDTKQVSLTISMCNMVVFMKLFRVCIMRDVQFQEKNRTAFYFFVKLDAKKFHETKVSSKFHEKEVSKFHETLVL